MYHTQIAMGCYVLSYGGSIVNVQTLVQIKFFFNATPYLVKSSTPSSFRSIDLSAPTAVAQRLLALSHHKLTHTHAKP